MTSIEDYEEFRKIREEKEYCLFCFFDKEQKDCQEMLPEVEECLKSFPNLKLYIVEKEKAQSIIDGEEISRFPTTTIYQYIYNTVVEKIKIEGKINKYILNDCIKEACEKETGTEENDKKIQDRFQSKFHPDHPLIKKEDKYFMCYNCFEYYGEEKQNIYYCNTNHYYVLCEKCKTSEENGEKIIKKKTEKSRHHPIHDLKEKEDKGKMCLGCLEEFSEKQKFYVCEQCEYYLCQKCHDKEEEDKNSE